MDMGQLAKVVHVVSLTCLTFESYCCWPQEVIKFQESLVMAIGSLITLRAASWP